MHPSAQTKLPDCSPLYNHKDTVYLLVGVVQLRPALLQHQRPEVSIAVGPRIDQLIVFIHWEVIIDHYFLVDAVVGQFAHVDTEGVELQRPEEVFDAVIALCQRCDCAHPVAVVELSLDDVVGVDLVLHESGARDDLCYALPLAHCFG